MMNMEQYLKYLKNNEPEGAVYPYAEQCEEIFMTGKYHEGELLKDVTLEQVQDKALFTKIYKEKVIPLRENRVPLFDRFMVEFPITKINEQLSPDGNLLTLAVVSGCHQIVERLLAYPELDVNLYRTKYGDNNSTPLLRACFNGEAKIVQLLLKDPRTDWTRVNSCQEGPFRAATHPGVMRVLLRDERITKASWRETPLHNACNTNRADLMNVVLDEDPDIEARLNAVVSEGWPLLPMQAAGISGAVDVVACMLATDYQFNRSIHFDPFDAEPMVSIERPVKELMARYNANPEATKFELRCSAPVRDRFIPKLFILIGLASFGLVESTGSQVLDRFLEMASKLPMKLQMKLAHTAYGSPGTEVEPHIAKPALEWWLRHL